MGDSSDLGTGELSLEAELSRLAPEERHQVEAEIQLRAQANCLARELSLDPGDVYHQLKQFMRPPMERGAFLLLSLDRILHSKTTACRTQDEAWYSSD